MSELALSSVYDPTGIALKTTVRGGHGLGFSDTVATNPLPAAPPPRRTTGERYERTRQLGEGAMGEVFLAHDHDIDRAVAVKRLKAGAGDAVARFAEEVRIAGNLEHPGIAPVHDVGVDEGGDYFVVMKHVQGETLEHIIDRLRAGDGDYRRRFTQPYRVELFAAILETLQYAHAKGIIHRDLKPGNIMIGPFGEVTILDWGIAKQVGADADRGAPASGGGGSATRRIHDTHAGMLVGTPLYMSPEQALGRNKELDARSDVYSLAVLCWEWLSLEHPRGGAKTVQELLVAIAHDAVDCSASGWLQLSRIRNDVPCEYAWFVAGGLGQVREARYADAGDMLKALRRAMSGQFAVRCHATLVRRGIYGALHLIDRHGWVFNITFLLLVLSAGYGLVQAVLQLVRHV